MFRLILWLAYKNAFLRRFDIFTIAWNVAVIYGLNFLSLLYPLRYINSFTPLEALRHV